MAKRLAGILFLLALTLGSVAVEGAVPLDVQQAATATSPRTSKS